VSLFRRKSIDPARAAVLTGFLPVGEAVEAAQRALLGAIPSFREDGVALAHALGGFTHELDDAERALANWDAEAALVNRCTEAIRAARAEAAKLRLEPNDLVFAALNGRIGDVLHPLEDIADLEAELREGLRR
jgi:hypothetical protein